MSENEVIQAFLKREVNIWVPSVEEMLRVNKLLVPCQRNFFSLGGEISSAGFDGARVLVFVDWDSRVKYSADPHHTPPARYNGLPVVPFMVAREDRFVC